MSEANNITARETGNITPTLSEYNPPINQSLSLNFLCFVSRKSSVSSLTSLDIKKSAVRFMSVIAPTAKSVVCQIASEETKAPRNAEAQ